MNQQTLIRAYKFEGRGLHTGKYAHLTLNPAPAGYGIRFVRIDLDVEIPALASKVTRTDRSTTISEGDVSVVTIEHLMTMSAPFRFKYDPWKKVCTSSDWGLTALEQIGGKSSAGERFHYTTIGIQILSDIFQRATGKSLNAFAERELFSPLGIAPVPDVPITDKESQMRFSKTTEMRGWARDPSGHYTTGWGLSLTAEDMAKIGLLVLNKGSFGGRQLVSQSYIDHMTSCRQKNYGCLWWVYPKNEPLTIMRKTYSGSKADIFCAQGVGGTLTAVIPEADTVISMICSMKYFPRPRFELIDRIISRYI